jgi:hypothetical protein
MHPLEKQFKDLLAVDTRPVAARDKFQAAAKRKRTTLRDAKVMSPEAAALAVKKFSLGMPDNAGNTVRGVLKQGPMLRTAIVQGGIGDCYFLAGILGTILVDPLWFDKYVILPVTLADGTAGCLVYFYERKTNSIVEFTTSLEVSTSYNNPHDADIRPEILEKNYAFFRRGVNDFLQLNWGNGTEAGDAFGFKSIAARQSAELPSAFIDKHRAAGRFVTIVTSPKAVILVASHAYAALDGRTLINTWDGGSNVAVADSTLQNLSEVAAMYALEPANILPRLPAAPAPAPPIIIPTPNPMPQPTPVEPKPEPEKPMPIQFNLLCEPPRNESGNVVVAKGTVVKLTWGTDGDAVRIQNSLWNSDKMHPANGQTMFTATDHNTVTLTATKAGSEPAVIKVGIVVKDAPPAPTPLPTDEDPIVSVVVVATRKSGKVTNTPIS